MELVTGFQGKNHVTAAQLERLLKGLVGSKNYVLETQDRFAAELLSVNKISIGTGDLVADGGYFTNEAPEELIVENGAVGLNRNDIVVCRYTKAAPQTDEDGNIDYTIPRIENGTLAVVKGVPSSGTPQDPEVTTASLQDNNTDLAEFPLWRLPIRGLSVETPEPLFATLQPADEFRDSQSPRCLARGESTSYTATEINLSDTCLLALVTKTNVAGRWLATTILPVSEFVKHSSEALAMNAKYAEGGSYLAAAYYKDGKVYLKHESSYDMAELWKLM